MKSSKLIIILVALISLLIVSGCATDENDIPVDEATTADTTDQTSTGEGRLIMSITDAAADMDSVTAIRMTTGDVQAHSNTQGWVTIDAEEKTYDLLELESQNQVELMGDANVQSGQYNQIRFDIKKVIVVDAEGEHEATVPSNEYKVNVDSQVNEGENTSVEIDVLADESLHTTNEGEYMMAPVAKIEVKSNVQVNVGTDNIVVVNGGQTAASTKVGMDINGNVGTGLKVSENANISIDNGIIKSGVGLNSSGNVKSDANGSVSIDL